MAGVVKAVKAMTRGRNRTSPRHTSTAAALAVAAALLLSGCLWTPRPVESPVELPAAFSAVGEAPAPERWWLSFEDQALNALVTDALAGNFSFLAVRDRLDQARAVAVRSGAALWPTLDGRAGASRDVTRSPATGRVYDTDYSLGVFAAYEVDLWGRIRAGRGAARLDVGATEQDLRAAAISLTATVARTWYRLVETRAQLALVDEQLEVNRQYLDVITLQFHKGQVGATDVLQQKQLVERTRGDRIRLQSARAVLEHELAVLAGRPPGTLETPSAATLPELPPLPTPGVPVAWVRRRPDVVAAERRVQAADARLAAAIADRFPRLSLSADAVTSADRVADLFDNWIASLAANLTAPLFQGGRLRAEVDRTRAVAAERLHAYGQTVLVSLAEVENALVREARQAAYVRSLVEQLALARQAKNQTLENYTKGTTDFLRYLTALQSYQRLQREVVAARSELVLFRIDLYRALAGGW